MHGQGRDPSAEVRARLREQMEAIEARGRAGGAGQPGADAGADAAEDAFRKIERLACMREQSSSALRSRLVREGFRKAPHARRSSARWHAGWWTTGATPTSWCAAAWHRDAAEGA